MARPFYIVDVFAAQAYAGNPLAVVLDADGMATRRDVKLGRQNPDVYEVLDGLQPGERVVTSRYAAFNDADELLIE